LQRAEHISCIIAQGPSFRENLVGTGNDDMSDSLDRRVAFRVVSCLPTDMRTAHP
jgi:hypothetical protein